MSTDIKDEQNKLVVERVAAVFEEFKRACMHPDAPEIQVSEMRTAFFAGAGMVAVDALTLLTHSQEQTTNYCAMVFHEVNEHVEITNQFLQQHAGETKH